MSDSSSIERQLGILIGKVEGIADRLDQADRSRAAMHHEINTLVLRATHLETEMHSTKLRVEKIGRVTDDVETMRDKALGAGAAGQWIVRIAIGAVGLAGWAMAAYAWLLGRPPP